MAKKKIRKPKGKQQKRNKKKKQARGNKAEGGPGKWTTAAEFATAVLQLLKEVAPYLLLLLTH